MKLLKISAIILFFPFCLLLMTLLFGFSLNFYEIEYDQVISIQKISKTEALLNANDVYDYLNGKKYNLNFRYTDKELLHLKDIKIIIFWVKLFTLILFVLIYIILILIYKKKGIGVLIKTIFYANAISFLAFLGIGVVLILSFDWIFLLFHQIFFRNDYWLLDPNTEMLINFFPPQFFGDLIFRISQTAMLINVFLTVFTGIFLARNKIKTSKT